jgi:hypothetical protein
MASQVIRKSAGFASLYQAEYERRLTSPFEAQIMPNPTTLDLKQFVGIRNLKLV